MTENFTPAKAGTQRPRLSKEEYAEKKRAEKDGVYQLADEAAKEIVSSPEKFKAFLDTQSRLDRYSAVNALLIYKQYPQAVQLKDFDDWSKDNIKITKGAKSISILEPVEYAKRDGATGISYNVKKVFDVAQTNGKRPPAPTANRDPKALITTMLDSSPVNVEATNDPITVVNNLSDFIFGLIRAIGLILLGFGIVQVGLSLKSHDPSQRANGFLTLAGGIIITFAKEILTLITG